MLSSFEPSRYSIRIYAHIELSDKSKTSKRGSEAKNIIIQMK